MVRRQFTQRGAALGILGSAGLSVWPGPALASLAEADAVSGVRAALERGAQSAVKLLGRNDGFLGNPKVRIPLPGFLEDAARLLKATGQQRKVDELVTAMNRAAEAAVPQAPKPNAISCRGAKLPRTSSDDGSCSLKPVAP